MAITLLLGVMPAAGHLLYDLASPNEEAEGLFGRSVSGAGDVNNDGFDDLVVGASSEDPGSSPTNAGRAYIFSGKDGSLLNVLISPNEQDHGILGISVSGIGDINGDDCDDVIVGAYLEEPGSSPHSAGRAYVFSGQNGDALFTLSSPNEQSGSCFGFSVSGAGDADADGVNDVVVGAWGEGHPSAGIGVAYVFSGQDGAPLDTLLSPSSASGYPIRFGYSVSGMGDINGDGYDDILVGASYDYVYVPDPVNAGRAHVFSGQDGNVLLSLDSPNPEQSGYFGQSLSGAGDVNGDGVPDAVVGAYRESADSTDAGRAYVFSGIDGSVIYSLVSPNQEMYGGFSSSVSGAGDVDGDGYADVIVGADTESPGGSPDYAGRAYVFSGFDGSLLSTLVSPNEEAHGDFGQAVSHAGDVNSDGYADVIVSAHDSPGSSPDNSGRAYVMSEAQGSMVLVGKLSGSVLTLNWTIAGCALPDSFWVFGSGAKPYFLPDLVPPHENRITVLPPDVRTLATITGIGDSTNNWTYLIVAVGSSEQEMYRSNRAGEQDFELP